MIALSILAGLLTAACGDVAAPGGDTTPTTATTIGPVDTTAPPLEHGTGATDVVLRVSTAGGFVPLEASLAEVPEFTLYGDGRVLTLVDAAEWSGPYAYETFVLDEAGIQAVLSRARETDLFEEVDYGEPQVTDLPGTSITIGVDGAAGAYVYALGFTEDAGLTPAQQDARARLGEFTSWLDALPGDLTTTEARHAWVPSGIDAFARPAEDTDVADATAWPLDDPAGWAPYGEFGTACRTISGAEIATLAASLPGTGGRWSFGDRVYYIALHTVLPDATGCTVAADNLPRVIETESFEGVIMDPAAWDFMLEGGWAVSESDILELEAALPAFLDGYTEDARAVSIAADLGSYRRQYVGYAEAGTNLVYVNGFCPDPLFDDWETDPVIVNDGGDCFWYAIYDPAAGTFTTLAINGEA